MNKPDYFYPYVKLNSIMKILRQDNYIQDRYDKMLRLAGSPDEAIKDLIDFLNHVIHLEDDELDEFEVYRKAYHDNIMEKVA
jgi:hypothetical protein